MEYSANLDTDMCRNDKMSEYVESCVGRRITGGIL